MTLNEWKESVKNNKGVDYDGYYGKQCVDLVNDFANRVLGIKDCFYGLTYAYEIYTRYSSLSKINSNFSRIYVNEPGEYPKVGDVIVWGKEKNGYAGHTAVCIENGSTDGFKVFEQNYDGKGGIREYTYIGYKYVSGWLRPKNQSGISSNTSYGSSFVNPVAWKNGSTIEKVFEASNLSGNIGSISPREKAECYGKKSNGYITVYKIDGSNKHKVGFVKYAGGVKSIPSGGKPYKNGSTIEKVYLDTAKKNLIGNLDKNESCTCLGIVDGMYLVLYKINGSSNYKVGFVSYNGGIR